MTSDERHMRQALRLALRGLGNTSPNPVVGAVVVDANGEIVGRGHHERAGADHAEVVALREAGEKARGAAMYVTLEPCIHQGRTPPCVEAIQRAGIARVVSAMEDPDPRMRGNGHARLRESGIDVAVGIGEAEARHLNRMYVKYRTTGRPFVTLKMAQSLDGAAAPRAGARQQLTGSRAAKFVRKLRFEHDAVMVGAGTVETDDPQLTVRPFKPRAVPYIRVVVDARGRMPIKANVTKDQARAKTIVATTEMMPSNIREALLAREIEVLECARSRNDLVDLTDLLGKLAERNIVSVLCEGGPTLAASLMQEGHIDELVWIVAPLFIAGREAVRVIGDGALQIPVDIQSVKKLGDDVLLTGQVRS